MITNEMKQFAYEHRWGSNCEASFEDLTGKTIVAYERNGDEELFFLTSDNLLFKMHHHQDCCENVYIESIVGDLDDLLNTPILKAEESTKDEEDDYGETMWTFYKMRTSKGYIDIRWNGSSNGYYSVSVDVDVFDLNKMVN